MRKLQYILILSVALMVHSCFLSTNKTPSKKYEKFIDSLLKFKNKTKLKFDSINHNIICNLDFKKYFEYFNQLYIDSNWTLESHYRHFGESGRPLLLAFKKNDSIANNLKLQLSKNKLKENSEDWNLSKKLFDYQDSIYYLTPIHIKSNYGYFQFITFVLLGDKYCLFWHSNYYHIDIITSKKGIIKFLELENNYYYHFSKAEKELAMKIDPIPKIKIYKDSVTVRIITLGPWEGFVERKFSITKKWPHKYQQYEENILVKYNCGIIF